MKNPLPKILSTATLLLGASALIVTVPAQADTYQFTLTGTAADNYSYWSGGHDYTVSAGPYQASLKDQTTNVTTSLLVYCLDENKSSSWNTPYSGTISAPVGQNEAEAAWLAAYSLTQGAPSTSHSVINAVEGPISMAIWDLMGTRDTPLPTGASPFITLAQTAYTTGAITAQFLANVHVFTPSGNTQRFITATTQDFHRYPPPPTTGTPEPGTMAMLGGGLVLVALGRRRR
jgi:hypothetical protein